MNDRRHRTTALLVCAAALSASCSERLTERDFYDPRNRCSPIVAYLEPPGQARFRLYDSSTGRNFDLWCTCTTHEQWLGEDEAFTQWVSEMSYEACLEFVEREGYDPADSTCEAYYEDGYWESNLGLAEDDISAEPEFCETADAPSGCGVD